MIDYISIKTLKLVIIYSFINDKDKEILKQKISSGSGSLNAKWRGF